MDQVIAIFVAVLAYWLGHTHGRCTEVSEQYKRLFAERLANCHLIAAAPELYAALNQMVAWYAKRDWPADEIRPVDEQEYEVKKAMRALAAARGERHDHR